MEEKRCLNENEKSRRLEAVRTNSLTEGTSSEMITTKVKLSPR